MTAWSDTSWSSAGGGGVEGRGRGLGGGWVGETVRRGGLRDGTRTGRGILLASSSRRQGTGAPWPSPARRLMANMAAAADTLWPLGFANPPPSLTAGRLPLLPPPAQVHGGHGPGGAARPVPVPGALRAGAAGVGALQGAQGAEAGGGREGRAARGGSSRSRVGAPCTA